MTVRQLIEKLQKLPQNHQVMLWDGWEGEYAYFNINMRRAERFYVNKTCENGEHIKSIGEWTDYVRYSEPEYLQSKQIVEFSPKYDKNKQLTGLR